MTPKELERLFRLRCILTPPDLRDLRALIREEVRAYWAELQASEDAAWGPLLGNASDEAEL
jgi:hypothetical protein